MSGAVKLRGYVALGSDFRSGKITPRAYLDDSLKLIAQLDPGIGAFVHLNTEGARKAADASTARWRDGKPLSAIDGMPIAIKDIIETADMPTGQGSPMWEGTVTRRDSASVHALREAGAIIIGKTTTTEFAASFPFHKTRNPHDSARTPGGSSAARPPRSARFVPAGLGTQWSDRSCGHRASAARSASSRASARSTAAARSIISAKAARAPSARRWPTPGRWFAPSPTAPAAIPALPAFPAT
jgi:hypothetical protein